MAAALAAIVSEGVCVCVTVNECHFAEHAPTPPPHVVPLWDAARLGQTRYAAVSAAFNVYNGSGWGGRMQLQGNMFKAHLRQIY